MLQIKIFTVGKTKENWLKEALSLYTTRLKNSIHLEWVLLKDSEQLEKKVTSEKRYFCLDPQGKLLSSEQFTDFLFSAFEKENSRLNFVIGDAAGLSPHLRKAAVSLISLSPMIFTHQMTRLIFAEQVYRALQIRMNSPYHS